MADDTEGRWWADPYALGVSEVYGQRVAYGHPETTDDERGAAGRPTLGATRTALEIENTAARDARDVDADLGAAPAVIIGDAALPIDELLARVADTPLAVWADGDVIHFGWRGAADHVEVIGSLHLVLHRRGSELWSVSMKVRALADACWDLQVVTEPGGCGAVAQFVGANVAAAATGPNPPVACDQLLLTAANDAMVSVYASPDRARDVLVLVGDGEDVPALAAILEAQASTGGRPGVVIAGVHSTGQDARAARLLPGTDPLAYAAHRVALFDVIVPALRAEYEVATPTVLCGFSAGAAWALDTALTEPAVRGAYAFAPTPYGVGAPSAIPPIVLGYGTLDPFAAPAAEAIAARLAELGDAPLMRTVVTGHDWNAYVRGFPDALAALVVASG